MHWKSAYRGVWQHGREIKKPAKYAEKYAVPTILIPTYLPAYLANL